MSVAFQTILAICLQELQPQSAAQRRLFHSVEAFAGWFAGSETVAGVLSDLGADSFGDLVTSSRANAPERTDWTNDAHEIQLGGQLIGGWQPGVDIASLLSQSLSLLAMLVARDDPGQQPYSGLAITPEALRDYPINLISFRSRSAGWQTMFLEHVVADLVVWCLDTHLRVAGCIPDGRIRAVEEGYGERPDCGGARVEGRSLCHSACRRLQMNHERSRSSWMLQLP